MPGYCRTPTLALEKPTPLVRVLVTPPEVEDFVEFLTVKAKKRAAFDRLLAIAPALEKAGAEPLSDEEIAAEIEAARAERDARDPSLMRSDADRS